MRATALPLALVLATLVPVGLGAGETTPSTTVDDDFVAAGPVESLPEPAAEALTGIRARALAAHVAFLASPALEGHGLGSQGLDAAAEYVAAFLARAGVPPAGGAEAGYFRSVPVRRISDADGTLEVERRDGDTVRRRTFAAGVDCRFDEAAPQSLSAPAVFVGRGIREPGLGYDDYRGLDVRGRVVVLVPGLPPGAEWQTPQLVARYAAEDPDDRYVARLETAAALGAVAVVAVEERSLPSGESAEPSRNSYFLPLEGEQSGDGPLLVRVSSEVGRLLLGETATAVNHGSSRSLPGTTVTLAVTGSERVVESRNVLAVLPGSDETLRAEAVVVGAHLDHLGRVNGVVYPGADDNASGVAALLEIARAFATLPAAPRRTLVLAFWTGEEEGKLGSGHYVRHPDWPLARTTAYLNLDMIGHPWSAEEIHKLVADTGFERGDELLSGLDATHFVEPGVAEWAPELGVALERAARATGLALHLDRTDGCHGGSDYRDFARAGVPFVRFFGNFFPGYHEPTDRADVLDSTQVERVARLAFATAYLVAER